MRESELDDLENAVNVGYMTLGTEITLKALDEDESETNIYGEGEELEYTEYNLIARVDIDPDEDELTDKGVQRDATAIFDIPLKQLREKELLDDNHMPIFDDNSVIEFKGREYDIVNINPETQAKDRYLLMSVEAKRE